jgi:purine-binding chemotaxis protein CheW
MSEQQTAEIEEQIVVFEMSGESYGVNIASVQEIIRPPAVTVVPGAPAYVHGVINLRGRVIPVISLRTRFGLSDRQQIDTGRAARIVVMEIDGHILGAEVDAVTEVLRLPRSIIEPPGATLTDQETRHLRGIAKLDGRLICLLNLDRILLTDEVAALAA